MEIDKIFDIKAMEHQLAKSKMNTDSTAIVESTDKLDHKTQQEQNRGKILEVFKTTLLILKWRKPEYLDHLQDTPTIRMKVILILWLSLKNLIKQSYLI